MSVTLSKPATPKQLDFLAKLASEREMDANTRARLVDTLNTFDTTQASRTITWLMAQPKLAPDTSTSTSADTVPEGMHKLGDEIFKVQRAVHGSGHLYAKRLVLDEPDCGGCCNGEPCGPNGEYCPSTVRFEYARGAMHRLSADTLMSLDEARAFGRLYGTCCVCGKTLTDESSIAAGIGPVCASKF